MPTLSELKSCRIGVLLGGLSAEREVSLQTGNAVLEALRDRGYEAVAIDVDRGICSALAAQQVQLAYIALHGRYGEDGCIQGLLESLQIPYTGAGVRASALAMDKVISKRLFDAAGLNTPDWRWPATRASALELGLPVVVKPRGEGSSVGVSIVRDETALDQALEGVDTQATLLERFVPGRELSAAVLGAGSAATCLGTVEIRPAQGYYDYQAKYLRDDTQYLVPAPLPRDILAEVERLAVGAHRALDCSGATRVDLRWDEDSAPTILEINTLPGMTGHSLLPKIAAHAGMSYGELVEKIALDAGLKA